MIYVITCDELWTMLVCRAGITFASIHDCFWTHASDVPVMNKVTFPVVLLFLSEQ